MLHFASLALYSFQTAYLFSPVQSAYSSIEPLLVAGFFIFILSEFILHGFFRTLIPGLDCQIIASEF